jgi:nitrogen fixation protein NifZ
MYRYREGDEVRLLYEAICDGTYHGVPRGEPLVAAGTTGFVKHAGPFLDDLVYDVHFLAIDRIVGCRERELIPADAAWTPPLYGKGNRIAATVELAHNGTTLVRKGDAGKITAVRYREEMGYVYEVTFDKTPTLVLALERQVEPQS